MNRPSRGRISPRLLHITMFLTALLALWLMAPRAHAETPRGYVP